MQLECSNCTAWSTGKLDIESTSGNFIYAYGNEEPATPNVPTSTFTEHVDHGNFNLNLKAAQVNTDAAPTITGSSKSSSGFNVFGLSERQFVSSLLKRMVANGKDYSDPRGVDGIDLGYFVPARSSHNQVPRQHDQKCRRKTSIRTNQCPFPPTPSRRNRSLPRLGPSIHRIS